MIMLKKDELQRAIKENGREAYEATLSEETLDWLEEIEEETGEDLFESYISGDGNTTPEEQVSQLAVIILDSGKNDLDTEEEIEKMIEKAKGVNNG